MTLSLTDIQRLAGTAGFRAETLEKVLLLLDLLDAIRAHPFAGPRVVLKGGTALNLFALDIPRLSVDIDLNYIGAVDRATMEKERPLVDRDLRAACERTGVTVKRIPTEHAGGKWRLSFVVYGAANRVDWRTVSRETVTTSATDVTERLLPMLRRDLVPAKPDVAAWTASLVTDCQRLLGIVLPLRENERAFLDALNDRGEILPELLTNDERLRAIIATHPALAWKAINARKHRGLSR